MPATDQAKRRKLVLFHWTMSSYFGWGVYGINLALHLAQDPDLLALSSGPFRFEDIALDPMRMALMRPILDASNRLRNDLLAAKSAMVHVQPTVLRSLSDRLLRESNLPWDIKGTNEIGVAFICDSTIDEAARMRARHYETIICGARWNAELLLANGITNVQTVIQGIDPTLFHPAPSSGLFKDRFVIFSGGKLELRKGQDLVVRAFRAFHQRHPDSLLVTAWHSPWSQLADLVSCLQGVAPVPKTEGGQCDVTSWLRACGLPVGSFIDLGAIPNAQMPPILREADVALFPNRCEPGTNLVAMECMACGVPVVVAANTGHAELIGDGISYPLRRQSPLVLNFGEMKGNPPMDTSAWGESDVEEMVETLEQIYTRRDEARAVGMAGSDMISQFTWKRQMGLLKDAILPMLA